MTTIAIVIGFTVWVVFLVWLLKRFFPRKGIELTRDDVAESIESLVDGESEGWDWDDFVSVPIDNKELDEIRRNCARLPKLYPADRIGAYCSDEGLQILRSFVKQLRSIDM